MGAVIIVSVCCRHIKYMNVNVSKIKNWSTSLLYVLEGYDPYDPYDRNAAYGAYGGYAAYPQRYDPPATGPRWGSLPNLYDQGYVELAKNPRERPLLQKLFGNNSVAQRKSILKRMERQQMDPFEKTAQWLMQSDHRGTR